MKYRSNVDTDGGLWIVAMHIARDGEREQTATLVADTSRKAVRLSHAVVSGLVTNGYTVKVRRGYVQTLEDYAEVKMEPGEVVHRPTDR